MRVMSVFALALMMVSLPAFAAMSKKQAVFKAAKQVIIEGKAQAIEGCRSATSTNELLQCVIDATNFSAAFFALPLNEPLVKNYVFRYFDSSGDCVLNAKVFARTSNVKVGNWVCN